MDTALDGCLYSIGPVGFCKAQPPKDKSMPKRRFTIDAIGPTLYRGSSSVDSFFFWMVSIKAPSPLANAVKQANMAIYRP